MQLLPQSPVRGPAAPERARRRAPVVVVAPAAPAIAAHARRCPRRLNAAAAARRRQQEPPPPLGDSGSDDDDDDDDDALFLAALADMGAEEEEEEAAEEAGQRQQQQQQQQDAGEQDADSPLSLHLSSSASDPYLLPGFGIERDNDDSDEEQEEGEEAADARQQRQAPPDQDKRRSGRRQQQQQQQQRPPPRPSQVPTLRALAAAVLAADAPGLGGATSPRLLASLSPGELVRCLAAWARLRASERRGGGGSSGSGGGAAPARRQEEGPSERSLSALRLLLLAAAERPALSPGQAAGALRAASQCCAALAPAATAGGGGGGGGDSGAAAVLPWPAVAALFGKLLLAAPSSSSSSSSFPPSSSSLLRPDLNPRAACEALWAAGALHARLAQDAAARRAAERHAALAPPPPPPPRLRARRVAGEDEGEVDGKPAAAAEQQQRQRQRQGRRRGRRAPADPPAPRPGEDARSELARLFLHEDGVAGTLPPSAQASAPAPLVRSEAQAHALAVAASASAAARAAEEEEEEEAARAKASASPLGASWSSFSFFLSSSSSSSSLLPGLPPEVLALACRLCDGFVAACGDLAGDDDSGQQQQQHVTAAVPLPELAAAAAAAARLQRPPGPLLRLLERRLCADGGAELRAAATRDLVTIAWAAGTAAEDAVAAGGGGVVVAGATVASSFAAQRQQQQQQQQQQEQRPRRLDAPADQVARVAQSVASRGLMACIASECRRRLERDAEVRARFAALAEAAIAEREQRARGVIGGAGGGAGGGAAASEASSSSSYSSSSPRRTALWPDAEAAGQMQDAEMPVVRTRTQADWLEELDELLRREGRGGGAATTGAVPSSSSSSASLSSTPSTPLPRFSPRLAMFPSEGERHLRPGGLMDRLAAADTARRQAASAASAASAAPADQRVSPAEAASLLVATARAAYLDDAFVDACIRAHGDAWASAAGTGAGTWPLRAGARPPRVSPRQRGALARVVWALALLGRCPAHDEDALMRHAVDAVAGSEAAVMSALPGDVLDLSRALAAGRVRLAAPTLRRWTARGVARAVAEGAGLGVLAARRKLANPCLVLPTPADALLPDHLAALALAAARLPRGAGAAAWAPPTALAAVSPWLPLACPLCSPSALADLAEAYALDCRPADDGGGGLAPLIEAAAASVEAFDGPTLARLLRSLLARAGEARRQRRAVRRRRARLARGEGLDHDVEEDTGATVGLKMMRRITTEGVGGRAEEEEEDEDYEDKDKDDTQAAAAASALCSASSPNARDHALESLPWRMRQRLRGSAAAPGRALLRAQPALPAPAGRPGFADAPYVAADASDAGVEARWRAYGGGGADDDGNGRKETTPGPLAAAVAPNLSPLLLAADERLRPLVVSPGALGPALALDLLAALASHAHRAPTSSCDRDRLAAWLAREVVVVGGQAGAGGGGKKKTAGQQKRTAARRAAAALCLAWAGGARLPAAGVAAPLAEDAAAWAGLAPAEAVDAAWALLRMGCCGSFATPGGAAPGDEAAAARQEAAAAAAKLLRGAARRLERVEAEASVASAAAAGASRPLRIPSSLPARLLYCWREVLAAGGGGGRGSNSSSPPPGAADAPLPPAAVALALRCLPRTPPDALCWLILALDGRVATPEEAELLRLAARELGKRRGGAVVGLRAGAEDDDNVVPLLAAARAAAARAAAAAGA